MKPSRLTDDLPDCIDPKTLDLVSYIRGQGYSASEITLMSLVADPEVTCTTRKQYQAKLKAMHGVEIPYARVCELWRDPKFQRCIDMIFSVEEKGMLQAVWKNLYRRASHPDDPHAVAAATLLFKAKGLIGTQRSLESPGGGDVNSYSAFIEQFRRAQKEGKEVTVRERTVTIGASPKEALPEEGPRPRKVVQGNFRPNSGGQEAQAEAEETEDPAPGEST